MAWRAARASGRTIATLVQAVFHGLAMQRAADPDCYDRQEMLDLVLDLLGSYLRPTAPANGAAPTTNAGNGTLTVTRMLTGLAISS